MTRSSPSLLPTSTTAAPFPTSDSLAPLKLPRGHLRAQSPARAPVFSAITAIAAVWLYFLIFTDFSFVEIARHIRVATGLKMFLGVLGLSGVAGSFTAAFCSSPRLGRWQLMGGFAGCIFSASLAWFAQTSALFLTSAACVGFSLSWTAVLLSLCLRPTLHSRRLGLWCGLGVGLAYVISNQPAFLEASAHNKMLVALAAACVGLGASYFVRSEPAKASTSLDYAPVGAFTWIVLFLVLVSLDSAAFYIIEHNSALYIKSWESAVILEGNAFVHLCIALLTGVALDRRRPAVSVTLALGLLVGSCFLLNGYSRHFPPARVLYTAGVSIYATVLVYLPARGVRPWFSGSLFAFACWLGSMLGLVVALNVRQVPANYLSAAVVIAVLMLFGRFMWQRARQADALDAPT